MRSLRPESAAFTRLLGALVTLASFATGMGLPVLDATAASLGVTSARAAYTLSVFIFGFALGPLLFGALSDRLGRRPVLLAGCAAFAGFGAVAASAWSFEALLLCCLLMGVGAGTVQVLVVAIVRDVYAGTEARVRQSYVNLAAGLAPVIAPTLGVLTASVGDGASSTACSPPAGLRCWPSSRLGSTSRCRNGRRSPLTRSPADTAACSATR